VEAKKGRRPTRGERLAGGTGKKWTRLKTTISSLWKREKEGRKKIKDIKSSWCGLAAKQKTGKRSKKCRINPSRRRGKNSNQRSLLLKEGKAKGGKTLDQGGEKMFKKKKKNSAKRKKTKITKGE